jgi:hypothetical protein
MKNLISPENRQKLISAGIPRQTVYKWNNGAIPKTGSRLVYRQITGEDFPLKKSKRRFGS